MLPNTVQKSITQTGAGTTAVVLVGPGCVFGANVRLNLIAAGSAKVQATISGETAVKAGTAIWVDWPAGAVTATADAHHDAPLTAVRAVVTAGTWTLEVLSV